MFFFLKICVFAANASLSPPPPSHVLPRDPTLLPSPPPFPPPHPPPSPSLLKAECQMDFKQPVAEEEVRVAR
jgi:hypothetical protein